jgi:hypothetical protein
MRRNPEHLSHPSQNSAFTIENRSVTVEFQSADEYLRIVSDVTGWIRRLEGLSSEEMLRLRQALTEAVAPHVVDGRVRLEAPVRCASGQK